MIELRAADRARLVKIDAQLRSIAKMLESINASIAGDVERVIAQRFAIATCLACDHIHVGRCECANRWGEECGCEEPVRGRERGAA